MFKRIVAILIALSVLTACTNTSKKTESKTDTEDAAALLAVFGKPVKANSEEIEKFPLGSAENPVRVSGSKGQRDYLSHLVCDNNEMVSTFSRAGNAGPGPYGTIIDVYSVICDTNQGVVTHNVYLDMYHPNYSETRPAAGFLALKK